MEFFSDLTHVAQVESRVKALDARQARDVEQLKTTLASGMDRALRGCRAQAADDLQHELARLQDNDVDERNVAREKDARLRAMTLEDLDRKGRKARDDSVKRKLFELAGFEREECDRIDAKYDEEHAPLKASRLGLQRELDRATAERATNEDVKLVAAREAVARLEHLVESARAARAQLDPLKAAEWESTRPADFSYIYVDAESNLSEEMTQAMRRRAEEEKSRGEQQQLAELIEKVDTLNKALESKQQALIEVEGAFEMSVLAAEERTRASLATEFEERVEQERRTYALAVDEVREKGRAEHAEAEARVRRSAAAVAQQEANERIAAIKLEFEASVASRVASVRHAGSQNEAKLQQRLEIHQQESDVQQSLLEKCLAELQRLKGTVQTIREEGELERARMQAQYTRATDLIAEQREGSDPTLASVFDERREIAARAAATKTAVAAAYAAAAKLSSAEPLSQIEAQIDGNLAQYPGAATASPAATPTKVGRSNEPVNDGAAVETVAAAVLPLTATAAVQSPSRSAPPTPVGRALRAASTIRSGFAAALNTTQVLRDARIKGTRLLELAEAPTSRAAWRERYLMVSILGWAVNADDAAARGGEGERSGSWAAAHDLTSALGGAPASESLEFPSEDIFVNVCFAGQQFEVALPRSASRDDPLPTPKSRPHLLFFVGTEDVVERLQWPEGDRPTREPSVIRASAAEAAVLNGSTLPASYARAEELLARESLLVTASAQLSAPSHAQRFLGEGEVPSPLLAREARDVAGSAFAAPHVRDVVTGDLAQTFAPWTTTVELATSNGSPTGLALDLQITVIDPTELASLGCGFAHTMPLGPRISGGKHLQQRVAEGTQHPLTMAVCLRGREPETAEELNCVQVTCGGRSRTLLVGTSTPVQTVSGACANHAAFSFDGRPESRSFDLSLFRTTPLVPWASARASASRAGGAVQRKFGSHVLYHVERWAEGVGGATGAKTNAPKVYRRAYMEVDTSGAEHTLRFGRGRSALAIEFQLSRVHGLHAFGHADFADASLREHVEAVVGAAKSDAPAADDDDAVTQALGRAFSFDVGPNLTTDDFLAAQARRSHLHGGSTRDTVARTFGAAFHRHAFVVTVCPTEEGASGGLLGIMRSALALEESDELGSLPPRETLPATVELHSHVPLHRPLVLQTYSGLLATVTWFDPGWIASELPRIMQARRRHKESDEWAQLELAAMQERVRKESGERAIKQKHDRELSYLRTLREQFSVVSGSGERGRLPAARTELLLRTKQEDRAAAMASSATMLREDHMYACERLKRLRTMLTHALRPLSQLRDDLLAPLDEGQQESERRALGMPPRAPHQVVLDWAKRRNPFRVQLCIVAGTGTWGEVRCRAFAPPRARVHARTHSPLLLTHTPTSLPPTPGTTQPPCCTGRHPHRCPGACDGRYRRARRRAALRAVLPRLAW